MPGITYQPTPATEIEITCEQITNQLRMHAERTEDVLKRVRELVAGQRPAIVSEMGVANAQALLATYTNFKEAIEAAKGIVVAGMPED